jgi:hypothetical protein
LKSFGAVGIRPSDLLPAGFSGELEADIEESSIPYDVDLAGLRTATRNFLEAVRREGIPWRS